MSISYIFSYSIEICGALFILFSHLTIISQLLKVYKRKTALFLLAYTEAAIDKVQTTKNPRKYKKKKGQKKPEVGGEGRDIFFYIVTQ